MITEFKNRVTVLSKVEYEEWKEIFKETGTSYKVVNESDYSGFQVKLMWND